MKTIAYRLFVTHLFSFEEYLARHWARYLVLSLLGSLVAISSIYLLFLRVKPSEVFLATFAAIVAQLLGFGGIILGIIYPPQRTLIRRLRSERIKWAAQFDKIDTNKGPDRNRAQPSQLTEDVNSEYVLRRIRDLNIQINDMRGNWLFTLTAFSLSFLMLGSDLVLVTTHLGGYQSASNSTIIWQSSGVTTNLLFQMEMSLFMGGVVLLLYGFFLGAVIPEGPVQTEKAFERTFGLAQRLGIPTTTENHLPEEQNVTCGGRKG